MDNYRTTIEQIASFSSDRDFVSYLGFNYAWFVENVYSKKNTEKYRVFFIPKKSGDQRKITSPNNDLKEIQSRLHAVLTTIYKPKASTQGFIEARSILTNADRHSQRSKKNIFNIDIKNFFPSISYNRIKGLFTSPPYNFPEIIGKTIGAISCHNNELPQGSPSSPILSNMICSKLDSNLTALARKAHSTYTRYADDISFSTSSATFPVVLIDEIISIINKNGFEVNKRKTRLMQKNQRQEVTGLIINEFPNVRRSYIRHIRAMLHDWEINGYDQAEKNHNEKHLLIPEKSFYRDFQNVIHGKIEFVRSIRGENDFIYKNLYLKAQTLEASSFPENRRKFTKKITISGMHDYGTCYALIVGINDYDDNSINKLDYCVSDANLITEKLKDCGYTTHNINSGKVSFDNKKPIKDEIESIIRSLCQHVEEDDILVIYFSCHGTRWNGKPYLIMQNTRHNMVDKQGVSIEFIEEELTKSKARVRCLILDACQIGIGRQISTNQDASEFLESLKGARGYALIAASTELQAAHEEHSIKHGAFSYYFANGISVGSEIYKNGFVTISDLYEFIRKNMKLQSASSGYFQEPLRRFEGYGDLPIIIPNNPNKT